VHRLIVASRFNSVQKKSKTIFIFVFMSTKYKVRNNEKVHFITITVVEWIDVFTRLNQKVAIPIARICDPWVD
jgi:hypothetical protein